jgi:hypothetical protein
MQRPIRVAQELARKDNEVRLAVAQDVIRLLCRGDETDSAGGDPRFTADSVRVRREIPRSRRGRRAVDVAAGGAVYKIHAVRLQKASKLHGFINMPSTFRPIGAGDAGENRQGFRPRGPDCLRYFTPDARAILERASIAVRARVGKRREELVHEVSMREVQLDHLESGSEGPQCCCLERCSGLGDFGQRKLFGDR